MAKSTVELQLWLDDLTEALRILRGKQADSPFLSIELFNDGSFRIQEHMSKEGEVITLRDSDDIDPTNAGRELTINDLPYLSVDEVAGFITRDDQVRNLELGDL
jgi:hypothetical protein